LPHTREDLITKIAPYDYNPDADCSRFLEFLSRDHAARIDARLSTAMFRLFNVGDVSRSSFLFSRLRPQRKSVFLDLFSKIFGGYSQNTTADSLMKKPTGSIPNDIARLRGCRFITCAETEEGKRLHESMLKQLTGGDVVTARFLFSEYFDFYFSGKIFIATNHLPAILDTSQGFWDRVKLIPFTVQIEPEKQIDKDTLLDSMLAEAAGILAWLVEGFQKYQEQPPPGRTGRDQSRGRSISFFARFDRSVYRGNVRGHAADRRRIACPSPINYVYKANNPTFIRPTKSFASKPAKWLAPSGG
jgi:putative DNA primase/helicase